MLPILGQPDTKIFGVGAEINISGDIISRNGISYNKGELVEKVVAALQKDTSMHVDFDNLFLSPLETKL